MPIYVKIDNIVGEVKGRYAGFIEVQSCQWGVGSSQIGGLSSQVNQRHHELHIARRRDSSSTAIFTHISNGKSFGKVEILFVKDNGTPFKKIDLQEAVVVSYSSGPTAGGAAGATETFVLNSSKVTLSAEANSATVK